MLYNFWGPYLVEDMDALNWEEKSLEENRPKVNFEQNKMHFEDWLKEQMLMIYNAAQVGARYDSKIRMIKEKICLLFDDYLHRMSLLADRDYECFRQSARDWVKQTECEFTTLLAEYETLRDLPPRMKAAGARQEALALRMQVNREVRDAVKSMLDSMRNGSLSSLEHYRNTIPTSFYSNGRKVAFLVSHRERNVAYLRSSGRKEPKSKITGFDDCHIKGDLAKLKEYLHSNMDGKTDVMAFRYIQAAVIERFIERPEITVVRKEFNVKGDKTTYNDYVGDMGKFLHVLKHKGAIESIKKELHDLLDEKSE